MSIEVKEGDAVRITGEQHLGDRGVVDTISPSKQMASVILPAKNRTVVVRYGLLERVNPGSISDGYHTFNELYNQRAIILAAFASFAPDICWMSSSHHPDDEDMYEGYFIFGVLIADEKIEPTNAVKQCNFHLQEAYWNLFVHAGVQQLSHAPRWDGHTPEEGLRRIEAFVSGTYERQH